MKLFYDNKAAISIANNLVQHDKTKHDMIDQYSSKKGWAMGAYVFRTFF